MQSSRQAPLPSFLSSERRSVTSISWGAEAKNRYSPILQWRLDANPTSEGVKSHLFQGASLCRSFIIRGVMHLKSLNGLKDLPVTWERELNMHLPNPRAHSPAAALPWPRAGRPPPKPQRTGLHHTGTPCTSQHGSASIAGVLLTLPRAPGQNIHPARGGHTDLIAKAKKCFPD